LEIKSFLNLHATPLEAKPNPTEIRLVKRE
jgi:hypothetical protein